MGTHTQDRSTVLRDRPSNATTKGFRAQLRPDRRKPEGSPRPRVGPLDETGL